jgi:hypothetical protein
MNDFHDSTDDREGESAPDLEIDRRFFVRAGSVNAVRRALFRAPGGAEVVGRYDRETIECVHTMDAHSLRRHWPVIVSRLEKAGLAVVSRPPRLVDETGFKENRPAVG